MKRLVSSVVCAACLAVGLVGCGDGAGGGTTDVVVTRDFGATAVAEHAVDWSNGLTAMRQLQRSQTVETQYGGKYVSKIGALGEGGSDSWLYYVNGVESATAATSQRLQPGDVVQWDLHNWQDVRTGGAIVGAFPHPLAERGAKIVCGDPESSNCSFARKTLTAAGVDASDESDASVVVGTWREIAAVDGVRDLSADAASNGAFAQFSTDGKLLTPARSDGSTGAAMAGGTGLVAAFSDGKKLTWILTGTDGDGVESAIDLLRGDHPELTNRFAVIAGPARTAALPLAAR